MRGSICRVSTHCVCSLSHVTWSSNNRSLCSRMHVPDGGGSPAIKKFWTKTPRGAPGMASHDRIVVSTASAPSRGRAEPKATACMGNGALGLAPRRGRRGRLQERTDTHTAGARCMRCEGAPLKRIHGAFGSGIQSGRGAVRRCRSPPPPIWLSPRPAAAASSFHGGASTIGILPMHCSDTGWEAAAGWPKDQCSSHWFMVFTSYRLHRQVG